MYLLDKTLGRRSVLAKRQRDGGAPPPLSRTACDLTKLAEQLSIPCPNPTTEDLARDRHRLRGQFLARQERWSDLTHEVMLADDTRQITASGMPVAELLCYGARADVVVAVEHALIDGKPSHDAPLIAGIEALEEMLAEDPLNWVRAVVVAQAHMDLGWAWRGTDLHAKIPKKNLNAFDAHFDRARDILSQCVNHFPQGENPLQKSPLFASATCTLNANGIAPNARLAQEYERLIDLNPMSPAPMRALGSYLSPRWYGSHAELELEARRTAARTYQAWGAGGYTWVMMDALAGDPKACAQLDVEFFVEGLQDILDRMPDQHTANVLASYCSVTMGSGLFSDSSADETRAKISECSGWIVRNYITELHPLIWAHAAAGFDNNLRVPSSRKFAASGQQSGVFKIAEVFSTEIEAGNRIVFTDNGPIVEHC